MVEQSIASFAALVLEKGFTVLDKYAGFEVKLRMKCPQGHMLERTPSYFKKSTCCPSCNPLSPENAKIKFFTTITRMGGRVTGEYVNTKTKVECRCSVGHLCLVLPSVLGDDCKMCKPCGRKQPGVRAEARFRKRAQEEGVIVKGKYVSCQTRILCLCKEGHDCYPKPASIQVGGKFCKTCSGLNSEVTEETFLRHLHEHGYRPLENYQNSFTPVISICPFGHRCKPSVNRLASGFGLCSECNPRSRGEDKTRDALETLGVKYNREFSLPGDRRRYDFELPDQKIIVEADGKQHFGLYGVYMKTAEQLELHQIRDCVKMLLAKIAGYTVVRIDQSWYGKSVAEFATFIKGVLDQPRELREDFIYSTPEMYDWMIKKLQ